MSAVSCSPCVTGQAKVLAKVVRDFQWDHDEYDDNDDDGDDGVGSRADYNDYYGFDLGGYGDGISGRCARWGVLHVGLEPAE